MNITNKNQKERKKLLNLFVFKEYLVFGILKSQDQGK
jgi:hypothetical protein